MRTKYYLDNISYGNAEDSNPDSPVPFLRKNLTFLACTYFSCATIWSCYGPTPKYLLSATKIYRDVYSYRKALASHFIDDTSAAVGLYISIRSVTTCSNILCSCDKKILKYYNLLHLLHTPVQSTNFHKVSLSVINISCFVEREGEGEEEREQKAH